LARTDTTAQSEAAEIRTVSELAFRGLIAAQYPRNFALHDVFVFDPAVRRVVNLQVKYRHKASASYVKLPNLEGVDFVVIYRANAGTPIGGREAMQCWVVPASAASPGRLNLAQIPDQYLNAWQLVEEACGAIRRET
jgi:hypothetical protein